MTRVTTHVLDTTTGRPARGLALPNLHHLLVDLAPFGLDNPNQVFVPSREPRGVVEAELRRS